MCDDAFAFHVCGHAQQLADGDDTGAAHTCHHHAPRLLQRRQLGFGQQAQVGQVQCGFASARGVVFFLEGAALNGDKAGAKAFQAAGVFVAGALVDGALAAQRCFQGLHRQAVRLHATVATALAHLFVDHHAHGGVHHRAAFAATAFFGCTGLVINDDRGALDLSHLALNLIQHIAVENTHAFGQGHALVFFGFVGHHHNALRAFGPHAHGDLQHAVTLGPLAHLLAAGHGYRVVVQNFVGDVHASGNALANGQNAAVKISAIAQVGKNMVFVAERLLACPWHAFTAHLREADGAAVHPHAHEMATNAGHRTRAFGHLGRGVVRTARTEPRLPVAGGSQRERLHGLFFGLEHRQMRIHLRGGVGIDAYFFQTFGNGARNDGGR